MRVPRSDSLTPSRIQNRFMSDGVNSLRKQNPFIFCQILEGDLFFLRRSMGLWDSRI